MKTFDKKDVFSWSNSEEAKTYIGKTGYFNNDFEGMKRAIELGGPAVLGRVDTNSIWCFEGLGVSLCFGLFLPADKIKNVEEPKRYRAFKNHQEFIKETKFKVGYLINIHDKTIDHDYNTMVTSLDSNGIVLGGFIISSFETLFNNYEWLDRDGVLHPFGVEE